MDGPSAFGRFDMLMIVRLVLLLVAVLPALGTALAQERITYHGCVDALGRAVEAVEDATLPATFATRVEGGRAVIRYNPQALPDLQPATRMFLFGHECARLNLGIAPEAPRSHDDARRADCWGLTTLLRSRVLGVSDVAVIHADLQRSEDAWRWLPGPMRRVDLHACHREASGLQWALPTVPQEVANACTRACADALLACQRACRGPACEPCVVRYAQCARSCDDGLAR
jgi:hypothetical protein